MEDRGVCGEGKAKKRNLLFEKEGKVSERPEPEFRVNVDEDRKGRGMSKKKGEKTTGEKNLSYMNRDKGARRTR